VAIVKSSNVLVAELTTFLRAYNRALDTGSTSLTRDLLLTPYSVGGRLVMEQVGIARDLHILSRTTGGNLADAGGNYQLERSDGDYATVRFTFYNAQQPTTDIFIPAGTPVQTVGTSFVSSVLFNTIVDVRFPLASVDAYYSYDRARYEFTASAVCTEIGARGNIGRELITLLTGSIDQISGVTNLTASSGGIDEEDDDDDRERIKLKNTGRDLNTTDGLRGYALDSGFTDGYPIRVEDADSERSSGIDLFVIDPFSSAITETFTYQPWIYRYYLTNRPVKEVTAVSSAISGLLAAADYDIHIDETSPLRRSVNAVDYINVRLSASLPPGSTFTVTYTYSEDISNFQATLETEENNVLTADPLTKRAFPVNFFVNANLTLTVNADGPTTRNKSRNALSQFLATFRLSDDIQKSDIIIVLQQGYGDFPVDSVDSVIINSYYLQDESGTIMLPVDEVIAVGPSQYVIFGGATLI